MNPELERKLRHLRLSGFVQALPLRNQEAINNHLAYVEFLELLVEDELARRRDLLFQRRLKQAQMPPPKSLDEFDWSFNPKIPKQLILDLATLRFIPEHGGALILGPAGLGKSHCENHLAGGGRYDPKVALAPDSAGHDPKESLASNASQECSCSGYVCLRAAGTSLAHRSLA
jgi:hypothetical protein